MNRMQKILALLLSAALLSALALPVAEAGSVSYVGGTEKFLFSPGSEQSPTDLFSGFHSLMPGDSVSDRIVIRNDSANGVKIKLYLRALGATEDAEGLLSQLKLTVRQDGETVLFEAPANETAQLTDWTYLGLVYSGGEVALDVTLEVPVTLGNEYQEKTGYIDWQFKAEELPVEPDDPKPPHTGDESDLRLYCGLLAACLAALMLLLLGRRRREANT